MDKIKQVIICRVDLKMRKGKLAAQVAHASMAVLLGLLNKSEQHVNIQYSNATKIISRTLITLDNQALEEWLSSKFTKIVLGCNSEDELLKLHQTAKNAGILTALIQDAGDTEFHGVPTYTTCAIGPDYSSKIDLITKNLKLL